MSIFTFLSVAAYPKEFGALNGRQFYVYVNGDLAPKCKRVLVLLGFGWAWFGEADADNPCGEKWKARFGRIQLEQFIGASQMSIMTKRYALFAGQHYYPNGGFNDFIRLFDSIEDAKAEAEPLLKKGENGYNQWDWAHVADLLMGCIVCHANTPVHYTGFEGDFQWKEGADEWPL